MQLTLHLQVWETVHRVVKLTIVYEGIQDQFKNLNLKLMRESRHYVTKKKQPLTRPPNLVSTFSSFLSQTPLNLEVYFLVVNSFEHRTRTTNSKSERNKEFQQKRGAVLYKDNVVYQFILAQRVSWRTAARSFVISHNAAGLLCSGVIVTRHSGPHCDQQTRCFLDHSLSVQITQRF